MHLLLAGPATWQHRSKLLWGQPVDEGGELRWLATNAEKAQRPTGEIYSIIYFQDADGTPVEKSEATRAEAVEFDASGEQIFRTHLKLKTDTSVATRDRGWIGKRKGQPPIASN